MMRRRVVTLPASVDAKTALDFAQRAKAHGAHLLELRTDLQLEPPVEKLAAILPLLVSERGRPLPTEWREHASLVDVAVGALAPRQKGLLSFHAQAPLNADEAVALWERAQVPDGVSIKHVEPLGHPEGTQRLVETQERLLSRYGPERVTVLAMGPLALPFRAVLAERNALDYLALDAAFYAAPGQRLLEDAVRADRARPGTMRLAILGSRIGHSRSPRIHRPPFDRIDLPPSAPVGAIVDALLPHYHGFAVTTPFKQLLARHLGGRLEALNTLVRRGTSWEGHNTDIAGAEATLEAIGGSEVTVLGDGGVTWAIREAAERHRIALRVVKRADVFNESPIKGSVIWTWPVDLEAPGGLRFASAKVAVIAYGPSSRRIVEAVRKAGGEPHRLGARWFIAQARAQRALWEGAT